jgi:methionyl-tRNA synthetase
VQRTLKFIGQYFDGRVPAKGRPHDDDWWLLDEIPKLPAYVGFHLERYEFKAAIRSIVAFSGNLNAYFQHQEPWKLRRTDPDRCATVLHVCAQACCALAVCLQPFLPHAAERLAALLNLRVEDLGWSVPDLPAGHELVKEPSGLFTKVTEKAVAEEMARLGQPAQPAPEPEPEPAQALPPVTYDEFRRTQLLTATVVAAERVPKADKLLKLQLDVGGKPRQILAGIAQHYQPEDLIGRTLIIVANLEPRKLRGEVSEGMLLAATEDEDVVILTTLRPVRSGLEVR